MRSVVLSEFGMIPAGDKKKKSALCGADFFIKAFLSRLREKFYFPKRLNTPTFTSMV